MKDRRGTPTQASLSNPLYSTMQPVSGHVKPLQELIFAGYCSLSWVREFTTYLFYIRIKKAFSYTNLISAKIHSSRRLNRSAPLIGIHEYWYYYDFYLIKVTCCDYLFSIWKTSWLTRSDFCTVCLFHPTAQPGTTEQ